MSDKKQQKQHLKKDQFIEALEQKMGIVSQACKSIGIDRTTPYRWAKEDKEFAERMEEVNNVVLDFTESKLYELVDEKHPSAVIFLLKTRGKSRGYVEKYDIGLEGSGMQFTIQVLRGEDDES